MSKHDKLHLTLSHKAIIEVIELMSDKAILEIKGHLLKQALNSKFAIKMPDDFNEQCEEYLDELSHRYFEELDSVNYNSRWKIKDSIRKKLRKVADDEFMSARWAKVYKPTEIQISAALGKATKDLEAHVDHQLSLWKGSVDKHIEKRVNSEMAEYIDKAVEAKFELLKAQKGV